MDTERAKEIATSPVMAHVSHQGTQVYIEGVDAQSEMASVYHLKNPNEKRKVHVSELDEHNALQ